MSSITRHVFFAEIHLAIPRSQYHFILIYFDYSLSIQF
jgi:hypothetical protein